MINWGLLLVFLLWLLVMVGLFWLQRQWYNDSEDFDDEE